jgi:putative component of membrane protein insertase Oxa1/YidC/SpoIIIJ protein YidD
VASFAPPRAERVWQPWAPVAAAESVGPQGTAETGLADRLLAGYQRHLRRPEFQDSPGCLFEPSCSVYARQAMKAHGFAVGFVMTFSRLFFREAVGVGGHYAPIQLRGEAHLYDPAQ